MKRICAWCKKVMRDGPEKNVSHGICKKCAKLMRHREKMERLENAKRLMQSHLPPLA